MNPYRRQWLCSGLVLPVALAACSSGQQADNEAVAWNRATIDAVRKGSLGPPMAARAIAIVHTAIYDAWAPFDDRAVATMPGGPARVDPSLKTTAARSEAVCYAAYRALIDLFPAETAVMDAAMRARGYDPTVRSTNPLTAAGIGNGAAERLLADRHGDGSNQLADLAPVKYGDYTGYRSANTVTTMSDPERWQPLRFDDGRTPGFMAPHWGRVRPFALASGDALRPAVSLPRWGSAEYRDQADEVISLTAALDDRTKSIAEYWANGPQSELPPGHWCLFAQFVSERDSHSLDDDVKLFFILGNALMDAGIVCWDTKRAYDSVRPISAIRTLYAGQSVPGFRGPQLGIGSMAGESWRPYQPGTFITPPFAEFSSGHSTFSSAGAEVLKRFTGSDRCDWSQTMLPGTSTHEFGTPKAAITLAWPTFTAAAEEAGESRLLGGIHFRRANTQGQSMGRLVGAAAYDRAMRLISGTG